MFDNSFSAPGLGYLPGKRVAFRPSRAVRPCGPAGVRNPVPVADNSIPVLAYSAKTGILFLVVRFFSSLRSAELTRSRETDIYPRGGRSREVSGAYWLRRPLWNRAEARRRGPYRLSLHGQTNNRRGSSRGRRRSVGRSDRWGLLDYRKSRRRSRDLRAEAPYSTTPIVDRATDRSTPGKTGGFRLPLTSRRKRAALSLGAVKTGRRAIRADSSEVTWRGGPGFNSRRLHFSEKVL